MKKEKLSLSKNTGKKLFQELTPKEQKQVKGGGIGSTDIDPG